MKLDRKGSLVGQKEKTVSTIWRIIAVVSARSNLHLVRSSPKRPWQVQHSSMGGSIGGVCGWESKCYRGGGAATNA